MIARLHANAGTQKQQLAQECPFVDRNSLHAACIMQA